MTKVRAIGLPVGIKEIAERSGKDYNVIAKWNERGILGKSDWTVGGRPAWDWPALQMRLRKQGRIT